MGNPRQNSHALDGPVSAFEDRVAGAALISSDSLNEVLSSLTHDDFTQDGPRAVIESLERLTAASAPITPSTVAADIEISGTDLDPSGTVEGLINVAAAHAGLTTLIDHVASAARARIALAAAHRYASDIAASWDRGDGPQEAANRLTSTLWALDDDTGQKRWETLDIVLDSALGGDGPPIATTGLRDLDDRLAGGLRPGQLAVIAGRPAMGKSTLAVDLCRAAAIRDGVPALYISLEMSSRELGQRILAAEARVDLRSLVSNAPSQEDRTSIAVARARLQGAPMVVDEASDATWGAIQSTARAVQRRMGGRPMIIAIDYVGLITTDESAENRQNAISAVSRQAKLMAKSLNVAVILVAQLNRGPESRGDHRPMMSDLRESGSLEQDADVILLVFRPDYYDATDRPGEADIIIAKQRNGQPGTVPVAFQGHYSRFANLGYEPAL